MKRVRSRYLEELYNMVKELNNDVIITLIGRLNVPAGEIYKSELIKRYLEREKGKW